MFQCAGLLLASWAPKTRTNYEVEWVQYCQDNNITNLSYATYEQAMSFLAYLFHKENSNSSVIAVPWSAVSAILLLKEGKTFGESQEVSKMLKEIFKLRLTFPKYTVIYDPDIILPYMDALPTNTSLLLEDLTKMLCTLLSLLSGQRCQTIASLDLKFSDQSSGNFTFANINKPLNTFYTKKMRNYLSGIVSVNIYIEQISLYYHMPTLINQ